jgi:hypothetical protein
MLFCRISKLFPRLWGARERNANRRIKQGDPHLVSHLEAGHSTGWDLLSNAVGDPVGIDFPRALENARQYNALTN